MLGWGFIGSDLPSPAPSYFLNSHPSDNGTSLLLLFFKVGSKKLTWPRIYSVAEDDFEFPILLPSPLVLYHFCDAGW